MTQKTEDLHPVKKAPASTGADPQQTDRDLPAK